MIGLTQLKVHLPLAFTVLVMIVGVIGIILLSSLEDAVLQARQRLNRAKTNFKIQLERDHRSTKLVYRVLLAVVAMGAVLSAVVLSRTAS